MGERNVTKKPQPLPAKIESRIAELVQFEEFDAGDVAHCRAAYWGARNDWHKILIDCYEAAQQRQQRAAPVALVGAR
jgi:hypothetical protein